jgi:predicted secreted protein
MKSKKTSFIFAVGLMAFILIVVTVVLSLALYSKRTSLFKEGFDKPWHNYVDVIYYINLDNREDRKDEFLEEMRRMQVPDEKIVRISAINKPGQGDWGCSISHLITIERFMDTKHNNCIVFEDDFVFTQDMDKMNEMFESTLKNVKNYDIIMLSANEMDVKPTEHEYLEKVIDAQTTSGYMVNKSFAPILMQNYRDGVKLIEKSYKSGKSQELQRPFCVDQYWKRLQPQSNWYMFSPKLGVQRESYSDIQGGVVDYGV